MKKLVITVLTAVGILSLGSVQAANISMSNINEGIIRIDGTASSGEKINYVIVNPNYTIDDVTSNAEALQYMGSVNADENGRYCINIQLTEKGDFISGFYTFKFSNEDLEQRVYFSDINEKNEAAALLADKKNLANVVEQYKYVLGIDSELYNAVDKSKLAVLLEKYLTDNPIIIDKDNPSAEMLDRLTTQLNELLLLECYNEGKSELIFNNSSFNYMDIIDISKIDNDGVTLYSVYNTLISENGKKQILSELVNKAYTNVSGLYDEFAHSVIYYGIKNPTVSGYGHIKDILTDKNLQYVSADNELKNYIAATNKNGYDYKIMQSINKIAYNTYIADIKSIIANSDKGEGGTGGTGSSQSNKGFNSSGISPETGLNIAYGEKITSSEFSDIEAYGWAKDAINFLAEKGIIRGVQDGIFAPQNNLTREQAAKIIVEAFNYEKPMSVSGVFEDTERDSWYFDYVMSAYEKGVINGIDPVTFGVGKDITRQDFAVMLYRAVGADNIAEECTYFDSSDIAQYAKNAVSYFSKIGIINGYNDNTFKPYNNITRAEAAKMIYSLYSEGLIK
ncbi:MAG: S-layer homology domain-containing protein [Clostridia bacterium]|nr:S-layer homology domain-containing protein [Clostridia bacterium]